MRELVLVAKRLDAFPADGLQHALSDVFDADSEDGATAALLATLLAAHGLAELAAAVTRGRALGDLSLQLKKGGKTVFARDMASSKPPDMAEGGPKHGKWDGEQHSIA